MLNWFKGRFGIRNDSEPAKPLPNAALRDIERKRIGKLGEDATARKLLRQGYRILDRNYLCRSGEIDIIAEHRGHIVFVEVKTRSPGAWNTPESAVTPEKQTRIARAAAYYMAGYRSDSTIRYDIASVLTSENGKVKTVEIKQDAFRPE